MGKSEKEHFLHVPEGRVPVSEPVFDAWWHFENKENYFLRRLKEEKFVYDPEKGIAAFIPSREDSFERLLEEGSEFVMEQPSVEDVVERWTLMQTLVEKLTEEELDLMCQIFVFRKNDAEAAKALNIPKSTLSDRKKALIRRCREILGLEKSRAST